MNLLFAKELQVTNIYTLLMIILFTIRSTEANQLERPKYAILSPNSPKSLLKLDLVKVSKHLEWIKGLNNRLNDDDLDHLNGFESYENFEKLKGSTSSKQILFNRVYLNLNSTLDKNPDKADKGLSRVPNSINSDNVTKKLKLLKLKLSKRDILEENAKPINKVTISANYNASTKKNNLNQDDELYEIPNFLVFILTICYTSISFMAITGNLIILWIVFKIKKMRNPTNYLLANLSASDFLIG